MQAHSCHCTCYMSHPLQAQTLLQRPEFLGDKPKQPVNLSECKCRKLSHSLPLCLAVPSFGEESAAGSGGKAPASPRALPGFSPPPACAVSAPALPGQGASFTIETKHMDINHLTTVMGTCLPWIYSQHFGRTLRGLPTTRLFDVGATADTFGGFPVTDLTIPGASCSF